MIKNMIFLLMANINLTLKGLLFPEVLETVWKRAL